MVVDAVDVRGVLGCDGRVRWIGLIGEVRLIIKPWF